MQDIVPLLQTILWIMTIFGLLFYFRKDVSLIRKTLSKRLESGSSVKIGSLEIGELKAQVESVQKEMVALNEKASNLFLTTMSPDMYANLKKISSGSFGKFEVSKGLKRELYHLRDIGYIEIESITSIPVKDDNLSDYVKITSSGNSFIELREKNDQNGKKTSRRCTGR